MKYFLLLTISLFVGAQASHAETIQLKVDDAFCGEYDPFLVGDVCILYMTKASGHKIAVLYDFDVMSGRLFPSVTHSDRVYEVDSLTGMSITMESSMLEKIRLPDVVEMLKGDRSEYFYLRSIDDGESIRVVEN